MLQLLSQFLILALLLSFSPAQALAVLAGEEDGSPSAEATACWALKFADGNMTVNADGTCSIADAGGAGAGDIDAIGDVTAGSAFTGTQGTSLTFFNAGGNGTFSYNGSNFSLGAGKGLTWNSAGSSLTSTGGIALASGTSTSSQLSVTSNSLTSGIGIKSSSTSNSMTGSLIQANYSGTSSGNALEAYITDASASGIAVEVYQYGSGNALTISDESGDTTPFTVDASGNLSVGGTAATTGLLTANAGVASYNGATSGGFLDIFEDSDAGTNKTRFIAQAQAGDITYTLPADDGDAGEQLQTDGSGALTWEAAGSGSGAPTDATYITQTANGSLSAEQALSSLSTGIMRVATTTGVITSLTSSSDIAGNISDETGTGVMVFGTAPTLLTADVKNGATSAGYLSIYEDSDDGSNYTRLQAQAQAGNVTYTLPAADGSANNRLKTNGSGTLAWQAEVSTLSFVIDGGGSAITTGVKGDLEIPFACTINQATTLADQSGSIVVDIWKDTYANYPPTVADTITASAKPTLSSATKAQDATLTGWTTAITAGDTLRYNVDSITTVTRVVVSLKCTKT